MATSRKFWCKPLVCAAVNHANKSVRLALERLEDRTVPANTYTVKSLLDDGLNTLRWAVT
jgi:hypothetical protein